MKKLILTLICICYGILSNAQDNPYEVFGYKPKNVFEDKTEKFVITNADTTSLIKQLIFYAEKKQIEFVNEKGEVVNRLNITEEQIFRFMAIDPKSEKYSPLTPYNYVANNPIRFLDPDGRDLIVFTAKDKNGNSEALLYRNGHLYSQNNNDKKLSLYKGTDSFARKTEGLLNKLYGLKDKEVTKVLNKLETSKNHHTIQEQASKEEGSQVYSDKPFLANDGVSTGSDMYLAFGQKLKGESNSDESAIAHELNHSYDYENGNMKGESQIAPSAKDPAEIRSVNFENRVRQRTGITLRTTYGGVPIPKKYLTNPSL